MPRRESGLKPIGDSIKKIIERIRKEREERGRKSKPIRTQPKLPGMKKGGMSKSKEKAELKRRLGETLIHRPPKPEMKIPEKQGMKRGGMKDPSKAIRSVKPTLGRKKTEEFLRKLKDKKKKMGGGMLKYKKGTGENGVIYSDKKGKRISKEEARKRFDAADAAERRERGMSKQKPYPPGMKKGGMSDYYKDIL